MALPNSGNVTFPRAHGYGAHIESVTQDLYLQIASSSDPERRFGVVTAALEADRINTAENPEEFSAALGDEYGRSDFTGGEGLAFAHEREPKESAGSRFWSSQMLEIEPPGSGERRSVKVAKALEKPAATTPLVSTPGPDGFVPATLTASGTDLWYPSANTTVKITNAHRSTATDATQSPHAADPADNVYMLARGPAGDLFAAVDANGIHRLQSGTWAAYATGTYRGVWYAKSRVIAWDYANSTIVEIDDTGTATVILTLGFGNTPVAVTDAGAAVLVALQDGTIFSCALDELNNLGVVTQSLATQVSSGNFVTLASHGGVIFLATHHTEAAAAVAKVWKAQLGTDLVLTSMELLRTFRHATEDRYVSSFWPYGEHVWFAVAGGSQVPLWSYNLATEALVEAHRATVGSGTASTASAVVVAGQPAVIVNGTVDEYFVVPADTDSYVTGLVGVAAPHLITACADFYTSDEKAWSTVTVDAEVPSGTSLEVLVSTDPDGLGSNSHPSWVSVMTLVGPQTGTRFSEALNLESRWIAVQFRFTATTTATPKLYGFSVRGLPTTDEVVVRLPVAVGDWVERPYRRPYMVRDHGMTVYAALRGMEGKAVTLSLLRENLIVHGVLQSVEDVTYDRRKRGPTVPFAILTVHGRKVVEGEEPFDTLDGGSA